MIFAAVFAGGTGSRMGAQMPKQYLMLEGKPVIVHTIEQFFAVEDFEKILVLCPEAWVGHTTKLVAEYFESDGKITVLTGGDTRNGTLLKALDYIEENYGTDDESIILTHDAVRPFVTRRIIDDNIKYTFLYGACDTAVPATDTIVESGDGKIITAIPDRERMFQGQTPQSFNIKKLRETVNSLTPDEEKTLTDACKIYAIKGLAVYIVRGEVTNIKITYPSDLMLAKTIFEERD